VVAERAPGLLVEGDVLDLEGRPIGRHAGAAGFTVGQRKGIGIAAATALYVSRVETATNRVTVAPREALLRSTVPVEEVRWVDEDPPPAGTAPRFDVVARIRHGQAPVPAVLRADGPRRAVVEFAEPVFAPAPGQALVAYRGEAVLCGGTISSIAAGAR